MRTIILVAIATMLLGLGTLYTTAKASSFNFYDKALVPASAATTYEVRPPMLYATKIAYDPTPPRVDRFNELVAQHEAEIRLKEVTCLARNIYFEARGESKVGQIAVGQVTINRVKAGSFRDSICGVVRQHGGTYKNKPIKCQFEWYCNNSKHKIRNQELFDTITKLAEELYDHYYMGDSYPDIVNGALFFHAKSVDIGPRPWKKVVARIDNHIFYNTVARL